jgi:hypothetical protein
MFRPELFADGAGLRDQQGGEACARPVDPRSLRVSHPRRPLSARASTRAAIAALRADLDVLAQRVARVERDPHHQRELTIGSATRSSGSSAA